MNMKRTNARAMVAAITLALVGTAATGTAVGFFANGASMPATKFCEVRILYQPLDATAVQIYRSDARTCAQDEVALAHAVAAMLRLQGFAQAMPKPDWHESDPPSR